MKILENSTGGSSIGNNKEVQTARAKNVYRQTQNFDHRHNKGRTTKAQQRWNNHANIFFSCNRQCAIHKMDLFSYAVMMYWQIFSHPCLKVPDTTL